MRTPILAALAALLLLAGCASCEDSPAKGSANNGVLPADAGSDGVVAPVLDATTPPIACTPGAIQSCLVENAPGIEVCNPEGNAFVAGRCQDNQVCRNARCEDVLCVPETRSCKDGRTPQVCNAAGDAFETLEVCPGDSRCDSGFCLDQCQLAERTNSYIGCEYWAVELENTLLMLDPQERPLREDRQPPFALVLANTSPTAEASITVHTASGEPAQAIGSRTVGSGYAMPGLDLVTVHSEVLGPDGRRVQGPIAGAIENVRLPPNSLVTLLLPHRPITPDKTSLSNVAYRIRSTNPVIAYQFNPLCCNYNFTNDASLLLPTSVLTKNYMHMSFANWYGGAERTDRPYPATLTVVGTKADTQVTVQLPKPSVERAWNSLIYPVDDPSRIEGPDEQGRLRVTLQPFEVFNVAGAGINPVEDLTGARVTASEPVAVFGGHSCTNVPFSMGACDHLESQLFPMETWGNRFVAAPLKLRKPTPERNSREGTYWKFLAREANTRIQTGIDLARPNTLGAAGESVKSCAEFSSDPASGVFVLQAGQTCEMGTRQMFVIAADKPIMVGAFVSGQISVSNTVDWGDRAGDPAFFLLPPQEQYRASYSFLTPATYFANYVTVTMMPGFKVTLDGQEVDLRDHDYAELPGGGMVRAHIPVGDGPHTITADVPFGIVVYGYDNFVSYAYTGGLDLKKISQVD